MKQILLRAAIVLLAIYLVFLAVIAWAMRQPPERFGRVMAKMPVVGFIILPFETLWTQARAGHLQPGDPAPEFDLTTLDKARKVQLSSFRGRQPVVLVFGSYT
jgi:hypothetical protein